MTGSELDLSLKVHLCCGIQILDGWLNVDVVDFGQEVVADLNKRWDFLDDNSAEYIFCKDGFARSRLPGVNTGCN